MKTSVRRRDLLEGEQALARQPDVVRLRHAVLAAQVAAIGDRDAQAAQRPAEAIDGAASTPSLSLNAAILERCLAEERFARRDRRWTGRCAVAAVLCRRRRSPRRSAPAAGAPTTIRADRQKLKTEAAAAVDEHEATSRSRWSTPIFSYGELGFQEFETHRYLVDILKKNGFTVQEGIAGIPTAFMATWGSGKPVIALGSDIDGIPQASQKPASRITIR